MHSAFRPSNLLALAVTLFCRAVTNARGADAPIVLKVDAREVSRRVLHATLHIPARPGPLTLAYPKV